MTLAYISAQVAPHFTCNDMVASRHGDLPPSLGTTRPAGAADRTHSPAGRTVGVAFAWARPQGGAMHGWRGPRVHKRTFCKLHGYQDGG